MVNGTAALHMCCILAGVRPGDEVIVPALTFVATANAVAHAGAVPTLPTRTRRRSGSMPRSCESTSMPSQPASRAS